MPISKETAYDKIGWPTVGRVSVFVGDLGGAKALTEEFIPLDGRMYRCDGEVFLSDSRVLRGKFNLRSTLEGHKVTNIICFHDDLWYSIYEPELYATLGLDISEIEHIQCKPDRHTVNGPLWVTAFIGEDKTAHIEESLESAHRALTASLRTRLFMWWIRWVIGFGLIWLVTWWFGRFLWLWTVGIIVAVISLAMLIGTFFLIEKKTARVQGKLEETQDMDLPIGAEEQDD